jgi:hypothetical protein
MVGPPSPNAAAALLARFFENGNVWWCAQMGAWARVAWLAGWVCWAATGATAGVSVSSRGLDRASTSKELVLEKGGVTAVLAPRLAGAVYSVKWNGRVVVPELEGNGGSLQTAVGFDVPVGESPEVENPTEAGSEEDNYGRTTSEWLRAAVSQEGDEAYTRTRMAYWIPPGQRVPSSPRRTRARGSSPVSDVVLRKRVSLEDGDDGTVVMRYRIRLDWKERHWFTQVQILAVYLAREFDSLYVVNGKGRATRRDIGSFSSSPPDEARPIIVAASRDAAVGLVALRSPQGTYASDTMPWYTASFAGGHKDYGEGLREVDLTAISAVWHGGSQLDETAEVPRRVSFEIALVFGSVKAVARQVRGGQLQGRRRR